MIQAFRDFLTSGRIHNPSEIGTVLDDISTRVEIIKSNKKTAYYNIPSAFDIETTSFYDDGEKRAIMYEWTFGIFGIVFVGRTWSEFDELIKTVIDKLHLWSGNRLIVYVHNLSYEFQFIRKRFVWDKVFALEKRKPIYAITSDGVEFRCSYLLSGYNLETVGNNLQKYKVEKLVGFLDYNKIRHAKTPMTDTEIAYCVNDVKVVMAFVQEEIENNGNITRIPLTNTGYVRNFCRNQCFFDKGKPRKGSFKRLRYMDFIKGLTIEPDEYIQLKRAFQGGFTHANPFYTGKVVENVTSYDFTSSYPTVMVAEKFPMSKAEKIEITSNDELNKNLSLYCCLFDVEFTNLQSKVYFDSYLSISRCRSVIVPVVNNGRVVSAKSLKTTVTEIDYYLIQKFYTWDNAKIYNFRRYRKGYLPTDFVKAILKLYSDKTTLKGVDGKEIEYLKSKGMVNSCYG